MTFESFKLLYPILEALEKENLITPTPIQEQAIPFLLTGKDLFGYAQTGTGKSIAFLLPILQKIAENPRKGIKALILVPTRELVQQVGDSLYRLAKYLDINYANIYGGVPHEEQIEVLKGEIDILIATPGRLLDLINRQALSLKQIEMFVLDEADRMLDMGFIDDILKIIAQLPEKRQSMLFSATMPSAISTLADSLLNNPVTVTINLTSSTTELIEQKVYYIERSNKPLLLLDYLRKKEVTSAIIFTKTRKSADLLHQRLQEAGLSTDRLHSERSQHARETILESFRKQELPILIATDIAARGIDISHLTHVFNFELPQMAETYIHRIGRTGRAGKEGIAITFCDPEEKGMLIEIQKLMRKNIPVVENHTYATLALKKALMGADTKLKEKAAAKKTYKGSKANGDFYRRQKRERKK